MLLLIFLHEDKHNLIIQEINFCVSKKTKHPKTELFIVYTMDFSFHLCHLKPHPHFSNLDYQLVLKEIIFHHLFRYLCCSL